MVDETYADGLACCSGLLCEIVVVAAWLLASARMVVAEHDACGLSEQRVPKHLAHVDGCSCDASSAEEHRAFHAHALVEEQQVAFFYGEVLHDGTEVGIDVCRASDVHPLGLFFLEALVGELAGSHDGDGFCLADALIAHEFLHGSLAQLHKTVAVVGKYGAHDVDCRLALHAASYQDGEQFGFTQRACSAGKQAFARSVFDGPVLDAFHLLYLRFDYLLFTIYLRFDNLTIWIAQL